MLRPRFSAATTHVPNSDLSNSTITSATDASARASSFSWLAITGTAVSTVTTVLLLLGFGTALAVDSLFNVPYGSVFDSVSDLLSLASIPIAQLFTAASSYESIWRALRLAYSENFHFSAGGAAITILMLAYLQFERKTRLVSRAREKTLNKLSWFKSSIGRTVAMYVAALGFWVLMPGFVVAVLIALMASVAGLFFVPMLGMAAAEQHFLTWVISPNGCATPTKLPERRDQLPKEQAKTDGAQLPKASTCVVVTTGSDSRSGRVIVSAAHSIVIYDPATRIASRLPIGESTISPVAKLESDRTP